MTQLQTKSGEKLFNAVVVVEEVELFNSDNGIVAKKNGKEIGFVKGSKVLVGDEEFSTKALLPAIDPTKLVGKDPTTLTKDELVVLTQYLQSLAGEKSNVSDEKEATTKMKKAAEDKLGKKAEEKEIPELPASIKSIDDLKSLSAKDLWKDIAKPIVDELDGITSRSKKAEMIAAIADFYKLGEDEEVEEDMELEEDDLPEEMEEEEYEDDFEDEDEDEEEEDDEEYDEDEEEYEDEDEDDDYEDDEEDDEEEDEEDDEDEDEEEEDFDDDEDDDEEDDDELTPEDIDNLETKEEIVAIIKKYDIEIPKKKLSVRKVKEFIKQELFGDE